LELRVKFLKTIIIWIYPFILSMLDLFAAILILYGNIPPATASRYKMIIALCLSILFFFIALLINPKNLYLKKFPIILIFAYVISVFVSIFTPYTSNVINKLESVGHAVKLIGYIGFVVFIFNPQRDILKLARSFILGLAWGAMISSFGGVLIVGPKGALGRFGNEEIYHPGIISMYAGISVIIFYINYIESKKLINLFFVIIGMITLLLSFGKLSILGTFVVILILSYYLPSRNLFKDFLRITILGLPVILMHSFIEERIYEYTSNIYVSSTLSLRIPLWSVAWELISNNLIFGYGYDSSWKLLGESISWRMHINAHNDFINSLIDVGIIGTVPLFVAIVLTGINLLYLVHINKKFKEYKIQFLLCKMLGIFLFLIVLSVGESIFASTGGPFTLELIFLIIVTSQIKSYILFAKKYMG